MSFRFKLANNTIKWHTDNKNCVSIIEKGSTKLHLQTIAVKIFNLCPELSISLDVDSMENILVHINCVGTSSNIAGIRIN
jgi:hypothetical protein